MAAGKSYDIVLFGATGFTGELTAEYLARAATREDFRWAIAGRNELKLERLRKRLSAINPDLRDSLGLVIADINDEASLAAMAQAARVVVTTAGPYIHFGEPVLRACVENGADYADLTGEPEYVNEMLAKYGRQATDNKLRIVNCCGFDSIPHDLGAWFTVQELTKGESRTDAAREVISVEGFVRAGGTFSGGTWHSAIHAFSRARHLARQSSRRKSSDRPSRVVKSTMPKLTYRSELGTWVCPFPTIDPQVVKRSARAIEEYGQSFEYGHYVQVKKLPKLVLGVAAIGGIFTLAQLPWTRNWLLSLKGQGEGPSRTQMEKGWFQVTFVGRSKHKRVMTRVSGGDPGYGETSKMLAESALCLALDRRRLPQRHGILTPAAAMGRALYERLDQAGIRFEVLEQDAV